MSLPDSLLAKILDSLFDQVVLLGKDFRIVEANRPYAEAYGFEPSEITGKYCFEISHGLDHPCNDPDHPCPLVRVIDTGDPVTVEHIHPSCNEGHSICLEIKAIPIPDENSKVAWVAEILRDITSIKRLKEELGKTMRQSDQIFQTGDDGIIILDDVYRIVRANRNASELIGMPVDTLYGLDFRRFFADQEASLLEGMYREIGEDETKRICTEMHLADASGRHRDVEVCLSVAHYAGGRAIYALLRDITLQKRVENKLFEATQRFQKIAEMGEDAILVLGDGFQVEFANSMASDLTGYPHKELMGMDFLSLLDEKGRKFLAQLAGESPEEEGRRICMEMKLSTAYGRRRTCEVCFRMASTTEGNQKTFMYIRDLSERLRIENKLREVNEFLTNLIESSIDGIIAADMKGNVMIFNKGAERLLGYRAEEVIGNVNVANFYPPGVAQDIMRKLRDERFGGRGKLLPHRIIGVAKSGEHIPISLSGALIYEDGREIASMGIFYDLREILRTQEELLESETKFRDLFETVQHGLYFSSREGKFLDCNQAMVKMLGYSNKEEVLALDLAKDLYFDPAGRIEFQKMIERDAFVKDYEVRFKRKGGEPIHVHLTAHVRKDRSGNVLGYQGLIIDVTERRRLEQQLFQSEKLAAMGRLTAQIAHELNNPIYGVMNCLDLLKSEIPDDSKKRKFLDMAYSEINRISQLLKNMLSFFRPAEDVRTQVDLNKIIQDVILFIGKQLNEFKVKTVLDLEETLPRIFASGNQIKQVLLNLIMNARTAMPRGGTLTISSRRADGKVVFKISDTGVGIPPEIRTRLFEPFLTTKRDVKGSGLGLSVCFGIIRDHKGEIEVTSEQGVGTTFTVTLPVEA